MTSQTQKIGNYILGQTLGSGTTGKVKLAERIDDNSKFAIKIIKKSFFDSSPEVQRKIRREIALMRFLDHPHLLKLEEVFESPRHLYIVLEYAANGELFDFLVSRRSISNERALRFFRQIVYGLDYLHSHGFCHRDLKPENILLDAANEIKIGDFGFARFDQGKNKTRLGTVQYIATEIKLHQVFKDNEKFAQYDKRVDTHSLMISTIELFTGIEPYLDGNKSIPKKFILATMTNPKGELHITNPYEVTYLRLSEEIINKMNDGFNIKLKDFDMPEFRKFIKSIAQRVDAFIEHLINQDVTDEFTSKYRNKQFKQSQNIKYKSSVQITKEELKTINDYIKSNVDKFYEICQQNVIIESLFQELYLKEDEFKRKLPTNYYTKLLCDLDEKYGKFKKDSFELDFYQKAFKRVRTDSNKVYKKAFENKKPY